TNLRRRGSASMSLRGSRAPVAGSADEAGVAGDLEDMGQADTPMLELDESAGGPGVCDLDVAAVLRRIPRLQQEHQQRVRVTDERMLGPMPVEPKVRYAIDRAPLRFRLEEIGALLVGELPLGSELVVGGAPPVDRGSGGADPLRRARHRFPLG